jgi:hypothetical protein
MQSQENGLHIDINILPHDWNLAVYDYYKESIGNNFTKDYFYNNGNIKLNQASPELKIKLHFVTFINSIEEILGSFNLIISDLNILKTCPYYFQDPPFKRFYLIIRTFFYEFYRIKEKQKFFLIALEKEHYIEKDKVMKIKKLFFSLFQETLELRNNLVHHNVSWINEHIELTLLYLAEETGHRIYKEDTKEEVTWESELPSFCEYYQKLFYEQGEKVKEHVETVINALIKLKTI